MNITNLEEFEKEFPYELNQQTAHRGELDPEKIVENGHRQLRNKLRYEIGRWLITDRLRLLSEVEEMVEGMKPLYEENENYYPDARWQRENFAKKKLHQALADFKEKLKTIKG